MSSRHFLIISDLHIPFEHRDAMNHCIRIKKEYKIKDEDCYSVGDFTDNYFAGLYKHSPNVDMSPNDEIESAKKKIRAWGRAFPLLKMAIGNHDMRWSKKFFDSGIPDVVMRQYRDLLEIPRGWQIANLHRVKCDYSFIVQHGNPSAGINAHRERALLNGCNSVMGHTHAHAGFAFINSGEQKIWGANAGCLIDAEHWAFHYGVDCKHKPCIGTMVILNGGRSPLWLPL
jgi:hypothetical protein